MLPIPKNLQQAVRASHGRPIRLADPETHAEYMLLHAEMYDRMRGLLSTIPHSPRTRERRLWYRQGCARGGMSQRWTFTMISILVDSHEGAPWRHCVGGFPIQ